MDDVIKLIKTTDTGRRDVYGNKVITRSERVVFCHVDSVTRSEFYQGAQTGLHPSYTFTLTHFLDYQGETEIEYTDYLGTKKYDIIRTFRRDDAIELVCEERIGEKS